MLIRSPRRQARAGSRNATSIKREHRHGMGRAPTPRFATSAARTRPGARAAATIPELNPFASARALPAFFAPFGLRCRALLLQAGDERAQRRRRRRRPARGWRPRHRQTRVDLGEAAVTSDSLAPRDDAIGERDARFAALQLAHLEARGALAAHVESGAIALGRDEYAIAAGRHHLGEIRVEPHDRTAAHEPRRAEVLEPVLRALHAVEHALRAVGERHHAVLHIRRERAVDDDVAGEKRLQQAKVS